MLSHHTTAVIRHQLANPVARPPKPTLAAMAFHGMAMEDLLSGTVPDARLSRFIELDVPHIRDTRQLILFWDEMRY